MNFRILTIIFLACLFHSRVYCQDNTAPERPYIEYVTVDTSTHNHQIFWTQSPSPDVKWYNLYYEVETPNGPEGVKFDSLPAGTTSCTRNMSGLGKKFFLYSISAEDSSGNESLRTPGLHSTISCNLEYDSCNRQMKISWNRYVGWGSNTSGYILYCREGNGRFYRLDGFGPDDSVYIHHDTDENQHYSYMVEGIKNDGKVSRSDISSYFTYMPGPPEELLLDQVSVISENLLEISFSHRDTSEVYGYSLLRSSNKNSDFAVVKTVLSPVADSYTFQDSILTGAQAFYYKIGSLNSCREVRLESNTGVNILLQGVNSSDENRLHWNPYEEFPGGLNEYRLFREDPAGIFSLIAQIPSGVETYTDELQPAYNQGINGLMSYRLEAVALNSGDSSVSNILKIEVQSRLALPNVFTPNSDGLNDSFKPVLSFLPEDFLMIIYDRNGVAIFKTTDPQAGWDGTVNGKGLAPGGVYVYHIQFKSFTGTNTRQTGNVTVYYP